MRIGQRISEETRRKMSLAAKKRGNNGNGAKPGKDHHYFGKRGLEIPSWKGDKVGYHAIHQWLTTTYGLPQKCEFCGKVGNKVKRWNIHWALIRGKSYERKRENFIKLCISCHVKYDFTEEQRKKISLSLKGRTAWNKGLKGWTNSGSFKVGHK